MTAAGDLDEARTRASRLGLEEGQTVQEIGYDDDVDEALRTGIEAVIASELVDEDFDEVVDVVLMWWREDDGDLVYQSWADAEPDPEVAKLLRQNGREEARHGERVNEVRRLLGMAV